MAGEKHPNHNDSLSQCRRESCLYSRYLKAVQLTMIVPSMEQQRQYLKCSELRSSQALLRKSESASERSAQKKSLDIFLSLSERLRILSFCDFVVDIIINLSVALLHEEIIHNISSDFRDVAVIEKNCVNKIDLNDKK